MFFSSIRTKYALALLQDYFQLMSNLLIGRALDWVFESCVQPRLHPEYFLILKLQKT